MAEKKNPGRFTVQFNVGDPQQKMVCNLLEQQGRHKAQFIANAILHYVNCPETPEIPANFFVDQGTLEQMIQEVLRQEGWTTGGISGLGKGNEVKCHKEDGDSSPGERSMPWGNCDMSAIANTLAAFQKR